MQPHGLQHGRLPCPSTSPGVCSDSCALSRWCYLTISSSVAPFFPCLQSFPASGTFQMSWLFSSGGQRIRPTEFWSFSAWVMTLSFYTQKPRSKCTMCYVASVSDCLWPSGLWPTRLLCPWDSPGENTSGLPCPPPGDLPPAHSDSPILAQPLQQEAWPEQSHHSCCLTCICLSAGRGLLCGAPLVLSCIRWALKEDESLSRQVHYMRGRHWQPTPVFLPGESQGRGSLVGCRLWGRAESDMAEAT